MSLRTRDLPNLDFIRSAAVVLVVVAHLTMYTGHFPYSIGWLGQAGVYIFFVHTSLVLMWSLERDPHTGRFYVRRLFRIVPLWLVVLAAYVVFQIPAAPKLAPGFGWLHPALPQLASNIFLTFDVQSVDTIVGASWTLPLEVHMYLVLPVLFFFVRSTRQLWPLLVLDVLAIVVGAANLYAPHAMLLRVVPCFLPGIMAYTLYTVVRPKLPGWSFFVCFLLYALLMCRYATLLKSWMFCLGLGLGLPLFQQIPWRRFNKATHLLAKYSYGIYLTHIIAITVAVHVLLRQMMVVRVGSFLALLVGLPVVLYHGVEEPMIRLGSRLARRIEDGPEPPIDALTLSTEPAP